MSGHGHHDAGADPHAGHDDHHDDHHDQTTSDDFPADEPHSPGWLPLLGGGLFLAAISAFLAIGGDDNAADTEQPKPAPAAIAPAAAPPAQRPAQPIRPGNLPAGHAPVAPRPTP